MSVERSDRDGGMTTVSILTPSFNQAAWLPDNLRSVACQTYPCVEHVVMDGGSTDGTVELLEKAQGVVWRSEPDRGQADALNKAFAASHGEILGWINSDDAYYDCDVVADVVAFFEAHPEADVVYGHGVQTTDDGRVIQVLWTPPFDGELLKAADFITQPAAFIRRRVLSEPMLDESFHFTMDYELWLRLSRAGARFARIDRVVAIDRHQQARKSSTIKDVHAANLELLAETYDLHLSPEYDATRSGFYVRQRLMGALVVPRLRRRPLAFTAPPDFARGLLRRQVATRRSDWPAEYR
jgi:glycosyltransferase involved in cell wall biosynthesis